MPLNHHYLISAYFIVFGYAITCGGNIMNEDLSHTTTEPPLITEDGIPHLIGIGSQRNSSSSETVLSVEAITVQIVSPSGLLSTTDDAEYKNSPIPLQDDSNPNAFDSQRNRNGSEDETEGHRSTIEGEIRILQEQNNSSDLILNGGNSSQSSFAERNQTSSQDDDLYLSSVGMQYSHDTTHTTDVTSEGLDAAAVTLNLSQRDSSGSSGNTNLVTNQTSLLASTMILHTVLEIPDISPAPEFNTASFGQIDALIPNATDQSMLSSNEEDFRTEPQISSPSPVHSDIPFVNDLNAILTDLPNSTVINLNAISDPPDEIPTQAEIYNKSSASSAAFHSNGTDLFSIFATTVQLKDFEIYENRTFPPVAYQSVSDRQTTYSSVEPTQNIVKDSENETLPTVTTSSSTEESGSSSSVEEATLSSLQITEESGSSSSVEEATLTSLQLTEESGSSLSVEEATLTSHQLPGEQQMMSDGVNFTSPQPPREQQMISDDVKTTLSSWPQEQSNATSIDGFQFISRFSTREREISFTTDSQLTATVGENNSSDGELPATSSPNETSTILTTLSIHEELTKITVSETPLVFLPTEEPNTETDFVTDSMTDASNLTQQQTPSIPVILQSLSPSLAELETTLQLLTESQISPLSETNTSLTSVAITETSQPVESEVTDSSVLLLRTTGFTDRSSEPASETIFAITTKRKTDISSPDSEIPSSTGYDIDKLSSTSSPTQILTGTMIEPWTSISLIKDETSHSFGTEPPESSSPIQTTGIEIEKVVTQSVTGIRTSQLTTREDTLQTTGIKPQASSVEEEHTSSTRTTDRSQTSIKHVILSTTPHPSDSQSQTLSPKTETTTSSVIITSLWPSLTSIKAQTLTAATESHISPEETTPFRLETDFPYAQSTTTAFPISRDTIRQKDSSTRGTNVPYTSTVAQETQSDAETEDSRYVSQVTEPYDKTTTLETLTVSSGEVILSTDMKTTSVAEISTTSEASDYTPFSYTETEHTTYHENIYNFTRYPQLSNISYKECDDLTETERNNVITVVFWSPDVQHTDQMSQYVFQFCKWLMQLIIENIRNNMDLLEDRSSVYNEELMYANFTPSEVVFVKPSPFINGQEFIFSFFIRDNSSNDPITADIILPLLEYNAETLQNTLNLNVSYFLRGPYIISDIDDNGQESVLEQYGLLIAAVGLVTLVILLVLITAVIYLRCKSRRSVHCITDKVQLHPDMQVITELGDLTPAAEILREEMAEKGNYVNGSHVFTIGDDEGWLVPLGDVPLEDYNAPDVEDTKL